MKDQITHPPDNTDHSVAKQKFRITNWSTYNKALINRGSLTFWLDDEAIQAWYESATPSSRGRPQRYSDLAITTVLVIKRVFRLTLRAAQGFIDSIFALMNVPLRCPDYTSVSKRAKSVNVSFKTSTRGEIAHLVIDSTGLKVFGEGEWKVRKHGKERRRIWRKLHLAVDSNTHEVVCADLSLNNVTDSEAFPGLIRQTHRKIRAAAADGAYDTRLCHDELRRKKISALIPPRKGAGYWPGEYADRNRAVANQRLSGSNARWKWTTEYNRRSIAETAMYRMKQLLGDSLTLRDYDGQVAEAMAMVRALNRMTKAGMPKACVLPENPASYRVVRTKSYLFNKAEALIKEENLNEEAAKRYIRTSLKREYATENGTELNETLPKLSPLNPQYKTKKQAVFQKIVSFIEKFKGVGGKI
ncbi:IS5 family transposase [Escherichia coli]|nr:IS5 family transposase [Escherichia coli]